MNSITNFGYFVDNEEVNDEEVAGMIFEWKSTFESYDGWGETLTETLLLVHKAIILIKE